MDITGEKLERDINAPRRLTRSMAAKMVTVAVNIPVDGNRRVTRSMTRHLREHNPGGTGLDADTSRSRPTRQTGPRNRSKNVSTRKSR